MTIYIVLDLKQAELFPCLAVHRVYLSQEAAEAEIARMSKEAGESDRFMLDNWEVAEDSQ